MAITLQIETDIGDLESLRQTVTTIDREFERYSQSIEQTGERLDDVARQTIAALRGELSRLNGSLVQVRDGLTEIGTTPESFAVIGQRTKELRRAIHELSEVKLGDLGTVRLCELYAELATLTRRQANEFADLEGVHQKAITAMLRREGELLHALEKRRVKSDETAKATRRAQQAAPRGNSSGDELLDFARGEAADRLEKAEWFRNVREQDKRRQREATWTREARGEKPALPRAHPPSGGSGGGGSDGRLVQAVNFAADLNLLPRGYEQQITRLAPVIEKLPAFLSRLGPYAGIIGRIGIGLGTATVAAESFRAAAREMAGEGYAGAKKLDESFGRWGDTLANVSQGLKDTVANLGKIPALVPRIGGQIGRRVFGDTLLDGIMGEVAGYSDTLHWTMFGREASVGERYRRAGAAHDTIAGSREQDRLAEEQRRQRIALSKTMDVQELSRRIEQTYQAEGVQANALARSGASDEEKRQIETRIALIRQERAEILARKHAIRDEAQAGREALATRLFEERLRLERHSLIVIKEIEKVRSGRDWDARRIIGLQAINEELDKEIQKYKDLSSMVTSTADEEEKRQRQVAEHESRINQLMAKRDAEFQRQAAQRRQFADIQARRVDVGDDLRIEQLQANQQERERERQHQRERIQMLREGGLISQKEANEKERALAAGEDNLRVLKDTQRIERDRLERERKRIEELKKGAKTEGERNEAEERHLQWLAQQQALLGRQARDLAAAERQINEERKEQAAREETRRLRQNIENMAKARAAREQALFGEGGVLPRMQQKISPQQTHVQMLENRMEKAVREREEVLKRKLTQKEYNDLYRDLKAELGRQIRGPSNRDLQKELGRQKKAERDEQKEIRRKRDTERLAPGQREMKARIDGERLRQNEEERQRALRDGTLAKGMQSEFHKERAEAVAQLFQKMIGRMFWNGQITGEMLEQLQNAVTALMNLDKETAGLYQGLSTLGSQIQSLLQSGQRRALQNQGKAR